MEGGTLSLYRECLRNHAANLGSYATDGCGEFTLDDMSLGGSGSGSLRCAACGCHRSFHRKVIMTQKASNGRDPEMITAEFMDHSDGGGGGDEGKVVANVEGERNGSGKKRFRTKFTNEQKEKMLGFAEKIGWKLQRKELDDEIERFCKSVGVCRQVFKVWMHNHKHTSSSLSAFIGNVSSLTQ
ncbi:hypothetical protein TanjilG_05148 [Lupinus angustifolius]|uniref:ZF-HD dimerization-type domain-containing protein n=1 Tax=Lupinus angustifolius TaxID=3871 RepID=A0A394DFH6_LUPAN|nr:PREDICTED: zinc-finger homeodomain protein 7-like [Lupinus angustifolius]OIW21499.1 hypothetical protein TanjilG_05148 [Lupinus angustifolius]